MRFSMILEMVDRFTDPARRARGGVRNLTKSVRSMGQRVRRAARDVRTGERSLSDFARTGARTARLRLGQMFQRAGRRARRFARDLGAVARRLKLVERAGFATGRGLRKLAGRAMNVLKLAGAAVVGGAGFALFDLFRTGGQFEQYQVMLEGIEGSAAAARRSMKWVEDFTQKTPFELNDVMEAFVALKAFGIEPTEGSLENLGDAAAGMSKPLMQAVEAMADAMTGEFERLKEFGIRASSEGDRVTFTYRKNGEDIQRSVAKTGSAIEGALSGILSDRFEGAMIRQSTTMFGIISNLKDMWTNFLLLVAEAGIFDMVKDDLADLLANVKSLADSGDLKRWAEDISDRLEKAWTWGRELVENTDWAAVADDFRRIAEAASTVADAIMTIAENWSTFSAISRSTNPFSGGLVGEVYRQITGDDDGGSSAGSSSAPRVPARLPSDASRSLFRGASAATQQVEVGGRATVVVTPPPGWSMRTTSITARGSAVPLEVRTGRTMRDAA